MPEFDVCDAVMGFVSFRYFQHDQSISYPNVKVVAFGDEAIGV
jgi:hypothetical protein